MLTAKITGNKRKRLMISIPIGTLKRAFKLWPGNVTGKGDCPGFRVVDGTAFLEAVRYALTNEEEGRNGIHKLFDEAFERVLEDYNSGTEEIKATKT